MTSPVCSVPVLAAAQGCIHPGTASQVLLSLPDRTETRDFFPLVSAAGFAWRVLRRVRRPDLVHAVHVYQLVMMTGSAAADAAAPQQVSRQHQAPVLAPGANAACQT